MVSHLGETLDEGCIQGYVEYQLLYTRSILPFCLSRGLWMMMIDKHGKTIEVGSFVCDDFDCVPLSLKVRENRHSQM